MASSTQMHTCPRCQTGQFLSKRALSVHMNSNSCRNLSLWSQSTDYKRHNSKISNSNFSSSIFDTINKRHHSGLQRQDNCLMVNPSIPQMALAASANTDEDVIYNDSNYDSIEDGNIDNASLPNASSISTTSSSHRNINPPPGIKFGIHLQQVLLSHRGVDLSLYNDIINTIHHHSSVQKTDFSTTKLYHRNELTSTLSTLYNLNELKPMLHSVTLSDGSIATVPVFNVKAVLLSILHDPNKMQHDNFASGYDLFSGKSTRPVTHYDEIHTGDLWSSARDHYCGDDPNAFPLGLVCFYDKTHTDLFGSLSCAPFIATFSFFNEKCRCNDKFYAVLGYIPNLSYGVGKSNNKRPINKLQDEHNCLRLITDQIDELSNNGGFTTYILGKLVTVKTWIHFIAGDTSGHNNLTGQYNSSNAVQPYRDCHCTLCQLSEPVAQCQLITMVEYNEAKEADTLQEYSLHSLDSAFCNTRFSDMKHGIFGCVPAEMLHVSGNGIMKYQMDIINNIVGSGQNKKHKLHTLDVLHQNLVADSSRQSDRDMPRMSSRNGVTDGTKMSASERVGNMFLILCLLHTQDGKQLFADGLDDIGVSLRAIKDCLKLQLSFEKWVNNSNSIEDVWKASSQVSDLICAIKTCFPRTDGHGWNIPKMHSLSKMIYNIQRFGCAGNFSGQTGERALKSVVKDHAQQTQRRVNVFASQCADREFESSVYEYAYNDIKHLFGKNYCKATSSNLDASVVRGCHTVTFMPCDSQGRGDVSVNWQDASRQKLNIAISDTFKYALRVFACSQKFYGCFEVDAFTSARLYLEETSSSVLFHANRILYGSERYHFAMVKFAEVNDDGETNNTCPAKILGFFKYKSKGVPTPNLIEAGHSVIEIKDNKMHDDTLYAVVHTAIKYVSSDTLMHNFIAPFTLGDPKRCVYVVSIDNIVDPLYVFPDYGNEGVNYFCSLSYQRWGSYFTHKIN